MSNTNFIRVGTLAALAVVLTGCGSGSDVTEPKPDPRPTEAPTLNRPTAFSGSLEAAGQSAVSRYIKNGIFSSTVQQGTSDGDGVPVPASPEFSLSADYSTTNTQEAGVDEADRIEYDGEYLFLATYPQWIEDSETPAGVRVLQRQEDFSLQQVNFLDAPDQAYAINGLYHNADRLAVIGSDYPFLAFTDALIEPWHGGNELIKISVYDTTSPADAIRVADIQIEGSLLSTRRIDNQLYVVSSFVPRVEGLNLSDDSRETLLANYLTILDTPVSAMMPKLTRDNASAPLVDAQDCLIPQAAGELDGYAQLLVVTRINLQQTDDVTSLCLSTVASTLYMSAQNLYLATTLDNRTGFHKIALSDMSYQASGEVPGILGWRSNPNLRLDEEGDVFRVVSSDYSGRDPEHYLSILRQDGDQLAVIAQLPNAQDDTPIGKPNEDVFAVRFFDDRGYIVTFERIDPLYVLDLSVDDAPAVAGSLEIPGFSSYLQPMDNGFLLGIGQEVDVAAIPPDGSPPILPPVRNGMKVSLFDVRDPANPLERASIVRESTYTPVEFDYRALSVLSADGIYRFALPLESWSAASGETSLTVWAATTSLMLIESDTRADNVTLDVVGEVLTENAGQHYYSGSEDRSVIHQQHVYYIHGNQVWLSTWAGDADVLGPF